LLIITRTVGESIVLPEQGITITVLGVRNRPELDPVRLGIDAPRDVVVLRQELIEKEKHDGRASTGRRRVH
jgi:carbon storage regulator CsrA